MSFYDLQSAPQKLPVFRTSIDGIGGGTWNQITSVRSGGLYSGILDVPMGGDLDVYADSVTIDNPMPLSLIIDIGGGESIPPLTRRNLKLGAIRQLNWRVAPGRTINPGYSCNIIFNDPWDGIDDLYPVPIVRPWGYIDQTIPNGQTMYTVNGPFTPAETPRFLCCVGILFSFQNIATSGLRIYQVYNYNDDFGSYPALCMIPAGTGIMFVPCNGIVGYGFDNTGQSPAHRVDLLGFFAGQ